MKVQDFTGGLATRKRPQYLQVNEAAEYVNLDSTKGSLVGDRASSLTSLDLEQYMFYFEEEDVWLSEADPTAFLEYQGSVYAANGAAPKRYRDGGVYQLGITPPNTNDWSAATSSSPTSEMDGTYQYVLTYIDLNSGIESGPSSATEEFTVGPTGEVGFTDLPVSSDPQVTHKRLYRIGGTGTVFTLVATIPNATVVYTDTKADVDTGPGILETIGYSPAPTGLTHIAEYNGMLFGCIGPKLYYTPVGLPGAWSELQFLVYARNVVGMAKVPNGLIVLTDSDAHLVTGQNEDNLRTRMVDSEQGCVAWESIRSFGVAAVWASRFGICASSGGEAKVLSLDAFGPRRFSPRSSAVVNRTYYMQDSDGTTYVLDSRYGMVFKTYELGVSSLATKLDKLYGWSADGVEILFDSTESLVWRYKSPRFVEGASSELKAYKKIYMNYVGNVNVVVLIDDVEVYSNTFNEKGQVEFQVPTKDQRGSYIQFELRGTGEVLEYEYLAEGAQR